MTRSIALFAALALSLPAFAGFGASSFKKDNRYGANVFSVNSALDSDLKTAWMSDPEKDNVGQYLTIDVPIGEIDKLGIVVGWDKTEDTFKDYARVSEATVEVFNKGLGGEPVSIGSEKIKFEDKQGWQIIELKDYKIDGVLGGRVKVTFTAFHKGVDFPNLAVSEILVHLKEFPAETLTFASPPKGVDDKQDELNLIDGSTRSAFVFAEQKGSMTLEAPGYGIARLGLQAGPATYARPKTVVIKADDAQIKHTIPKDAKGMQWLLLPAIIGYTGSASGEVQVEIVDVWPGSDASKPLALSEIKLNASVIEEF